MAAAKEISLNAVIETVSSELDGIFKLKEHKNDAEGFSQSTTYLLALARVPLYAASPLG